jgi:hypothetical protein
MTLTALSADALNANMKPQPPGLSARSRLALSGEPWLFDQ